MPPIIRPAALPRRRDSTGLVEAALHDLAPGQQLQELSGLQGHALLVGGWETEGPFLQPLVVQDQAIAVPPEDLQSLARAVAEDEHLPAERVVAQEGPHVLGQT